MKYREYDKPVPVQFFNSLGLRSGEAIGVREIPMIDKPGKCYYDFVVRLPDGSAVVVWQRDILPPK